jgi:hypothetical protein
MSVAVNISEPWAGEFESYCPDRAGVLEAWDDFCWESDNGGRRVAAQPIEKAVV